MSNRCKSPWTSIFIEVNGKVKSCCAGNYYWGDLQENSIEEIINGETAQKIKEELINDLPSEYCSRCRRDEETTGYSQRNYYNQYTIGNRQLADSRAFVLRNADIRWNTLCNLNCVYCGPQASTKWQKIKGIPVELTERAYYEGLLDYIESHSYELEAIMLVGGEPLLPRQNTRLLKNVNDSVRIDMISNLSVDLSSNTVFQELKNKKRVSWQISLENINDKFEYVRQGADWGQIVSNLNTIKSLGHHITLLPVYCIYSATDLVDLYNFAFDLDIQIHWQNLYGPDYQNVANFSLPVRNQAILEIDRALELRYLNKFDQGLARTFLETMRAQLEMPNNNACDKKFLTWTEEYENNYTDKSKSFDQLWPELYSLLIKSV